jgi:hypothetical protein
MSVPYLLRSDCRYWIVVRVVYELRCERSAIIFQSDSVHPEVVEGLLNEGSRSLRISARTDRRWHGAERSEEKPATATTVSKLSLDRRLPMPIWHRLRKHITQRIAGSRAKVSFVGQI